MNGFKIHFRLKELDDIVPWGQEPYRSLHWFGMTDSLLCEYGELPLVYAGGVMSNTIIKNSFTEKYKASFAQPVYSSDNAAGIAYLTYLSER